MHTLHHFVIPTGAGANATAEWRNLIFSPPVAGASADLVKTCKNIHVACPPPFLLYACLAQESWLTPRATQAPEIVMRNSRRRELPVGLSAVAIVLFAFFLTATRAAAQTE